MSASAPRAMPNATRRGPINGISTAPRNGTAAISSGDDQGGNQAQSCVWKPANCLEDKCQDSPACSDQFLPLTLTVISARSRKIAFASAETASRSICSINRRLGGTSLATSSLPMSETPLRHPSSVQPWPTAAVCLHRKALTSQPLLKRNRWHLQCRVASRQRALSDECGTACPAMVANANEPQI